MNPWIEHVKEFAKKHKMSYNKALTDPDLKKGYVPKAKKEKPMRKQKGKKDEQL